MSWRWTLLSAVTVVAGVAVAVAVDESAGPAEWVFGSVLSLGALGGLHLAVAASRGALAERGRDRRLASVSPEEIARQAVLAERARLAADLQAVIRSAVLGMAGSARLAERTWDQDPLPALERVQLQGQAAVQELRRLLGLLRSASAEPAPSAAAPAVASGRVDLLLAAGAALLAAAEYTAWLNLDDTAVSAGGVSLLLICAAAATVGLRRAAPGLGALLCGLVFALSTATQPVPAGIWFFLTGGGLLWAVVRHGRVRDLGGATVLVAGVVVATLALLPENLPVLLLVMGGVVAGAMVARVGDVSGRWSRVRADDREARLRAEAERAVRAERLTVARDLHDVVSHAVGLMTVQAGAAAAQLPTDRRRARAALDRVLATATDTAEELDRLLTAVEGSTLGGGHAPSGRYAEAIGALVDRMRGAGLHVTLDAEAVPPGDAGAAVHRIVQEALTNALRYSPGSHVAVRVAAGPQAVVVDVEDDGPGPRAQARPGYGLVGIAERVHHLGGEVITGARADGCGFAVHVRLPRPPERPS